MARAKAPYRHTCRYCGATTWASDYAAFMRDHDRPQGGVCRQAQAPEKEQIRAIIKKLEPLLK